MSVLRRALWSTLAAALLGVLVAARLLPPAPSGFGTHLALGLPPCGFLLWSGLPCPTCGLTTAFAHLARLEFSRGLRAHPLGLPLFLLALLLLAGAVRAAWRAETFAAAFERCQADRWALVLALALLTTWLARLSAL